MSLYDHDPIIKQEQWYGHVPPWYIPQTGGRIGEGPRRSFVFCFRCHNFILQDYLPGEWPETITCKCGETILTRKPLKER
jgi:hypothetical protein